jgi:hypothetical protein
MVTWTDMDVDLSRRMIAEYREMPGLRLTVAQAARLWHIEGHDCQAALDGLVTQGLLARTAQGEYCDVAAVQRDVEDGDSR